MRKFAIRALRRRARQSEESEEREPLPPMSQDAHDAMRADIEHDIRKGYPAEQATAIAYRRAREGYYR